MSDLISRQAVMDATKAVMKDTLDSLPTRLEDGEEIYDVRTSELDFILNINKALQNAIKALPSETHEIRTETHGVYLDTISRQAAIDAIKNISDPYVPHPGNDVYWCVKAIEELSSVEPVGNSEQLEWIPCAKKLPEEEEKSYWVCTDGGYQCQCRWTNISHISTNLTTSWRWHIWDVPQYSKVIAWQPLPEPWKGEEHD